jgi:hypothetical protein
MTLPTNSLKWNYLAVIISASKHDATNPYPKKFKCIEVRSLKDLANIIVNAVWSPICWKNNRRLSDEFFCSDFLVLDYDDQKTSLDETLKWVKAYSHIVGTTKSHQKEKSGIVCDRFRVVIPWHARINDLNTYRQNMERILSLMKSDLACKDGARIYQPCKKIISIGDGKKAEWNAYEQPKKHEPLNNYYTETKTIPLWLQDFMTTPPSNGERNKTAYKIAYYLARYGFSEQQCQSAVMSAPIDLPISEKKKCAMSGYRYGIKNP